MTIEEKIESWFQDARGGGLVLPSGWFGRPYDNIHQLFRLLKNDKGFIVILDGGNLRLIFEDSPSVSIDRSDLILNNYSCVTVSWEDSVSSISHSDEFYGGEIRFIALPGS